MNILDSVLKLLPAIGPVVAALPEIRDLVETVKDTLGSDDQEALQSAYELAKSKSDTAHADLQALVAQRTGG